MCRLVKALYGHPESGGHWERHLEESVIACGGTPTDNHPSSFWFEETQLMLTVYVDDVLLSGPEQLHDTFWYNLRWDPEPLARFLGRDHVTY